VTDADQKDYFRPDIEGLRAVAIGAVLLFHAGVPGAEGGFVGVDVFFVISGFLITGLLVREWSTRGRIDLVAFYARRFRRLLPAALLVIAVTTLASYLVLSELRFPSVAGDAAAAALYVSNIRFAANAIDYLGAEAAPSPLLHFWSLSVEEQFYLFWPLIILVALRVLGRGRLWLVVAAIIGISFGLAVVWTDLAAPWAFFSLPTRAWQLGVGALIAVGMLRRPHRLAAPERVSGPLASLGVWMGLGLIAAGVVLISTHTPYPGTTAIVPVLGTALVIVGGSGGRPRPSRLLAMSLPRWLGRISYSLYLWHWPIIVLVPIALGVESLALNLLLVAVAVAVAAVSTELIEVPVRQGRLLPLPPRGSLALAGSASIIVAAGALAAGAAVLGPAATPVIAEGGTSRAAALSGGMPRAPAGALPAALREGPPPADLRPALAGAYYDLPAGYADGCHLDYATVDAPDCTYGVPEADMSVLLLGDSHAQQWLPALERLAYERAWRLRAITKGACPMVDVTVWNQPLKRAYRECDAWREQALVIIDEEEPDLVLVASADMYEPTDGEGRRLEDGAADAWDAGLVSYLGRLADHAPRVVVLADTPRVGYDPADCLASGPGIEACDADSGRMVDAAYREREAAAAQAAGVELVSATGWLCTQTDCPLVRGPFLVYRDSHHLTATFAAQLAGELGAALDAVTGDALAPS